MQYSENNHSWDEFQWENEFRKDDHRIAGYYRALAGCLDLPGEDELIRGRMAQAEPVLAASYTVKDQRLNFDDDAEDDENGQFSSDVDWRFKPGAEACRRVEDMAASWNRFASSFSGSHMPEVLAVSCRFGSLLEKVYALADNSEAPAALRISTVKRILASVNDLLGCLNTYTVSPHKNNKELADILIQLQFFREAAVDSLDALRKDTAADSAESF